MAKKANVVEKSIEIVSARSAALEQSKAHDANISVIKSVAAFVKSQDKDFATKGHKNEELEAELDAGYNQHFAETHANVPYIITSAGDFVNLSSKSTLPEGHHVLTYSNAINMTTVEYNKIENKGHKEQVKTMRDEASTYRSNRKGDIRKAILGVTRKARAANKTLMETWTKFFKDQESKVTNGKQTGDPHADMVTFKLARDAFFEVIKKRIQ
jgi:cytochrome oxidase Cu insertion factor (SCO1/SenC/PrrC family)